MPDAVNDYAILWWVIVIVQFLRFDSRSHLIVVWISSMVSMYSPSIALIVPCLKRLCQFFILAACEGERD